MKDFKLGVLLESFQLPVKEAIKSAEKIGADGVQIYGSTGQFSPENLAGENKKEFLSMLKDSGLAVSAVCGDFGHGFTNRDTNAEFIEKSKRVVDHALELGTNIVTTHIGVVPKDPNHDRYKIMQEACFELASYADSQNAFFAVETGPETSSVLKGFLDSLGSKGVSVNLDPANLIMVPGDDPVEAVYNLKDYIVHTHAKDGLQLKPVDPEVFYRATPFVEQITDFSSYCIEVALGQGAVKWADYLAALKDIGFNGYLTIERECGETPINDIIIAADFLRNLGF